VDPNNKPKQLNAAFVKAGMKYSSRAVAWLYRRTGGRIGGNWRGGAAFKKPVPTLLLEHRGRKSGKLFASPLVYITEGDDVIIVASMGGRDENPQWYHNLIADPDVHIEIRRDRRPVHAVLASPEEKERLWPKLVEAYADMDTYKAWTDRDIPVFVLKPR
jgi:deazaflavin-dependent oxidoreductase (nitroreductase family)